MKKFPSFNLEARLNLRGSLDATSSSAPTTVKLSTCYSETRHVLQCRAGEGDVWVVKSLFIDLGRVADNEQS